MTTESDNEAVERTGMGCLDQCQFQRQWRLISVAPIISDN